MFLGSHFALTRKEALEQSIRPLSGHTGHTEGKKSDGGEEEERKREGTRSS